MWSFERSSRAVLAGVMAVLLAACSFHLRGQAQLPFETLYIPGNNPLVVELKRNVAAASKTRLVDSPGDAQAVFGFTEELREKIILSFSAAGRVSEYQLRYRVGFRVTDAKGAVYLPVSEILLTRDMAYSDAQVLAKETEEALLYRDMQRDMVQQIMRRLVAAKPAPVAFE
ncbi:MAG TPA: LPS assembly lipoprotein LptE [Burkholderiales bacterium]|jgi:LPS-assembly lipoprotein|nr:LPS assembly lipoprotein LptE [Burkholderiales bacterium]